MTSLADKVSHRLIWPLRCGLRTKQPLKFALFEMASQNGVERYRLRESGLQVHLRHPYRDLWVFDEIFRRHLYEPPSQVRVALARLGRPPRIVDLGGHVGMAGLYFFGHWPDARITAFEPDPDNARLLRRTIKANAKSERWRVIEACGGNRDGTTEFVSGTGAMGHIGEAPDAGEPDQPAGWDSRGFALLGGTTVQVPLEDVFPHLQNVDLVKMDIEGGEWSILQDPRLASVPARAIVLEYHAFHGPPDPEHAVVRILEEAGYTVERPRESRPELGEGTVWAWRADSSD